MADYDKIETKWNADEEKLKIILSIEREITGAFLNYNLDEIYNLLRVYRIHASSKFKKPTNEELTEELNEISCILNKYKLTKQINLKKDFFIRAEKYFMKISSLLKESGIYFRENRSASTAILQR